MRQWKRWLPGGENEMDRLRDAHAIDQLLQILHEGDAARRQSAALVLGQLADRRAVHGLIAALDDPDPSVRETVVQALGWLGDPAAVLPLIKRLNDPFVDVRLMIVMALGWIGDETAIPGLIYSLRDDAHEVRRAATGVLRQVGTGRLTGQPWTNLIPRLLDILPQTDRKTQWAIANILQQLGPRTIEPLIARFDQLTHQQEIVVYILTEIGEPAIEPLIAELSDPASPNPGLAREALSEIGRPAVLPLATHLYAAPPSIQKRLQWALKLSGKLDPHTLLEILHQTDLEHALNLLATADIARSDLGDLQNLFAEASAEEQILLIALMSLQKEAAVSTLLNLLFDQQREIRIAVIRALGDIGSTSATLSLLRALNDEDWMIRWAAVHALRKIKDMGALQGLARALHDEDASVQIEAAHALSTLGPGAIPVLIENVVSENWRVQRAAAISLTALGQNYPDQLESYLHNISQQDANIYRRAVYKIRRDNMTTTQAIS